jgi:hypothetical protein
MGIAGTRGEIQMKIKMLKDWGWHKEGDVVDIFDVTAKGWISDGIAKPITEESRSVKVEQATMTVERRKVKP